MLPAAALQWKQVYFRILTVFRVFRKWTLCEGTDRRSYIIVGLCNVTAWCFVWRGASIVLGTDRRRVIVLVARVVRQTAH